MIYRWMEPADYPAVDALIAEAEVPPRDDREILLAYDGDALVGMIGRIPQPFRIGERVLRGSWMVNSYVRPVVRNQGIGWNLYRQCYGDDAIQGALSGELHERVRRIYTWATAIHWTRLSRAIYVLNSAALAARYGVTLPNASLVDVAPSTPRILSRVPDAIEDIWERCQTRYGITTERSWAWLHRRYIAPPRQRYRWVWNTGAVAILREEGEAVRIVDLWGEADFIRPLLGECIGYAIDRQALFVDFLCAGWPDREAFEGWTFFGSAESGQPPLVFNPPDPTPRTNHVGLWTLDPDVASALKGPHYITRGDARGDRP